jgi:tRNA(Ile)-lysidine synthase
MSLLEEFGAHLAALRLPPGRALVAVSGGPDSVVLLHLLVATRALHRLELVVAHFDHGIHPASAQVASAVGALAARYGLRSEQGRGGLGTDAGETAARAARYAWLEATRFQLGADLVITAHHADDQVETVLMRALKGSGPAGLACMTARRGVLLRPLLPFRRAAILRYLRAEGLTAWGDPANQDPRHLRSWVRGDLLPALRARLPQVDDALLRLGRQAARGRAAWNAALDVMPGLDFRVEHDGFSVAARWLSGYDSALGESLLMSAGRRVGCRLGPTGAGRILRLAAGGVSGTSVPLGQGWSAELAFDRLRVTRGEPDAETPVWPLQGAKGEGAWGRWRVRWSRETAPERQPRAGLAAWFAPAPLVIRPWSAGERLRPLGGTGRRLLVRCFQDARVPRSRRAGWPVLAGPGGVVWIPGVSRSDALLPEPGTEAVRVDAEHT